MRPAMLLTLSALLLSGCSDSESDNTAVAVTPEDASTASPPEATATPGPSGFDSPDAAFQAMRAAAEGSDFPAAVQCLTPESQEALATVLTFPLAMMAAIDPEKEETVTALLQRHGVSGDDASRELPLETTQERVAFITDILTFIDANSDGEEEAGPIMQLVGAELADLTINGSQAQGTVRTADGETQEMDFVQIDGRWLIQLSMSPDADGEFASGEMGFDLSGGIDAFAGGLEAEAPLEAVSRSDFDASWQVTVRESDVPARELLSRLADQMGLALHGADAEEALQQTVTIDKSGVSRIEVIEAVCRSISLTPVYRSARLAFRPGVRELPVAFSGPFTAIAEEITTDPATATGTLQVQVLAAGIPRTVTQQLDSAFDQPLEVRGVFHASGADLQNPMKSAQSWSGNVGRAWEREVMIGLRDLLRDVDALSRVELAVAFSIPTAVTTATFDAVAPGASHTAGMAEISLTEIDGNRFTFEYSGAESEAIQIIGYDADGMPLQPFSTGTSGGGGSWTTTHSYEDVPTQFEVSIVTAAESLSYDLTLSDIALSDHAQMPEALPELTYPGEAPVELEFVRLAGEEGFREVVFRLTNTSNKEIDSVTLTMSYLDADGVEQGNESTDWSDEAVSPGASAEIEVAAFFMPDGTARMKGVPDAVTFTDASMWEHDE